MVRLFQVQIRNSQPDLLQGEVQRGSLAQVDLVFENTGGVEGYLSEQYTGGYALLTNLRIIWISTRADGTFDSGVPCHLPLGAIANTDIQTSFLSIKPPKIILGVRINASGYPASDAVSVQRVVKLKLVSKGGKPDSWHTALQGALKRQAWCALPFEALQTLHIPLGYNLVQHQPQQPMESSNHASTSQQQVTPQQGGGSGLPGSEAEPHIIAELQAMGITTDRAALAAISTGNTGVTQAVDWLFNHQNQPTSVVLPSQQQQQQQQQPPHLWPPPMPTASTPVPLNPNEYYSNPMMAPQGSSQYQQQPQQPPPSALGVGVGGFLHREEQRAAATDASMTDALQDLEQLMAKAGEMAELAKYFRKRVGTTSGTTNSSSSSTALVNIGGGGNDGSMTMQTAVSSSQEEELDRATAEELANLGLVGAVTKESAGQLYHQELARQVAQIISGPVQRAGGMMPLPDVYCIFNRARFTDLVSPDDLLKAVRFLPQVGATLKLQEFASGVKVLQSLDLDETSVCQRISHLASTPPDMDIPEHSLYIAVIGPGITRVEVATALNVPLPVAAEHLEMAESKGVVCRDEGPDGLRFYKNFFTDAHVAVGC